MPKSPRALPILSNSGRIASHPDKDAPTTLRLEETGVFRETLAQSRDSVMITNEKGIIEYVNAAFEISTGFTASEAIGHPPSILKSGTHDKRFYLELWTHLSQGHSFQAVFTNRTKAGALYLEEKTIRPILDGGGRITHFVSSGRNVDARVALDYRLRGLDFLDRLTGLPNRELFLQNLEEYLTLGNLR